MHNHIKTEERVLGIEYILQVGKFSEHKNETLKVQLLCLLDFHMQCSL